LTAPLELASFFFHRRPYPAGTPLTLCFPDVVSFGYRRSALNTDRESLHHLFFFPLRGPSQWQVSPPIASRPLPCTAARLLVCERGGLLAVEITGRQAPSGVTQAGAWSSLTTLSTREITLFSIPLTLTHEAFPVTLLRAVALHVF